MKWTPFFTGSGPGGLRVINVGFQLSECIPGSSHGGKAPSQDINYLASGPKYDQQSSTSLLGGSAGMNIFFYHRHVLHIHLVLFA